MKKKKQQDFRVTIRIKTKLLNKEMTEAAIRKMLVNIFAKCEIPDTIEENRISDVIEIIHHK